MRSATCRSSSPGPSAAARSKQTVSNKERVFFLCTHNAVRSQMAEGLLRAYHGDRFEGASAGTEPSQIDPRAVEAMAQIGTSAQRSKSVQEFLDQRFDLVVTLCDGVRCTLHAPRNASRPRGRTEGSAEEGVRDGAGRDRRADRGGLPRRSVAVLPELVTPYGNDDANSIASGSHIIPLDKRLRSGESPRTYKCFTVEVIAHDHKADPRPVAARRACHLRVVRRGRIQAPWEEIEARIRFQCPPRPRSSRERRRAILTSPTARRKETSWK